MLLDLVRRAISVVVSGAELDVREHNNFYCNDSIKHSSSTSAQGIQDTIMKRAWKQSEICATVEEFFRLTHTRHVTVCAKAMLLLASIIDLLLDTFHLLTEVLKYNEH
jgi:hypothetical protein